MHLDLLTLSRIQFALTIMFHYLFPPLTIGLGAVMTFTEGMYLKTRDSQYETMAKFWTRIFAVNFAMGVATGIVMEFQFGTNWAVYSRFVGDVFGSALAAEGIFAFFLESGFLAVLVFGWERVSARTHFISTLLVFLGSIFSAVWIVVANSWQQTPSGYHIVGHGLMKRAEITNFWAVVFGPSSMIRLTHTVLGALILGSFFVMSITAYYILRGRFVELSKKSFSVALILAAICSLAQLVSGDAHAREVARYQPAKLAAFEGHFRTGISGSPIHLFGWPDVTTQQVKYSIAIPNLLSYLVYRNPGIPVRGLDQFPRRDWPPVAVPFLMFHLMVGLGFYFIALTLFALFLRWRGVLFTTRWLLWVFVFSVLGPYAANQFGWVAAEVGRQPWVVQGLLRTSAGVSKVVPPGEVLASIIMFGIIYILLFIIWVYVLNDKIHHGPDEAHMRESTTFQGLMEAHMVFEDPSGGSMTSDRGASEHETSDGEQQ